MGLVGCAVNFWLCTGHDPAGRDMAHRVPYTKWPAIRPKETPYATTIVATYAQTHRRSFRPWGWDGSSNRLGAYTECSSLLRMRGLRTPNIHHSSCNGSPCHVQCILCSATLPLGPVALTLSSQRPHNLIPRNRAANIVWACTQQWLHSRILLCSVLVLLVRHFGWCG